MAILLVPSQFASIAAAVAAATAGDTIHLEAGYAGNEAATVTVGNLVVDGPSSVANVTLTLAAGVSSITLTGGANIDVRGNGGPNSITGNAGDNDLRGNAGNDTLNGGGPVGVAADDDWADYAGAGGAVKVTLTDISNGHTGGFSTGADGNDTLVDIENLRGGDFADTLTGNAENNHLRGGAGADTLIGGGHTGGGEAGASGDWADYRGASGSVRVTLTDGTGGPTGGFSTGADGADTLIDIQFSSSPRPECF